MKFLKKLFKVGQRPPDAPSSKLPTSAAEAHDLQGINAGPITSPSPGGDLSGLGSREKNLAEPKVAQQPSERERASQRRGEGELNFRRSRGDEALTNTSSDSGLRTVDPGPKSDCGLRTVDSGLCIDPDNKRNGKIARLPREIREKINQCLASGQSAVSIARQLNKLPEVKSVLQTHFGGRPILPQNLSEWRAGGYRAWLLRQEMLHQQKELAADASEMGKIAQGMADSLLRMLELDYACLLKNRHNETPEEFEKKRKALSIMIKDVTKLCHCEHQNRSVEVQEGRLEQHREKSVEEVHGKFMGWARHPGVRKAFFLEPQACDAQMRAYHDLPLTLEDQALLKELGLKEAEFRSRVKSAAKETEPAKAGEKRKNQTKQKPSQTENSPPVTEPRPSGSGSAPVAPPASGSPEGCGTLAGDNIPGEPSSETPRPEGALETPPISPDVSRPAPDAPPILDATRNTQHEPTSPDSGPRTVDSGLKMLPPKMPLTAYQEAILEGKSPEEAEAASKYCSPAKRERRRREYEQYRKELAAYEAQVKAQPAVTPVFHNPSQLSGFSPHPPQPNYHSPLGEIHHPSDRWRVQTS